MNTILKGLFVLAITAISFSCNTKSDIELLEGQWHRKDVKSAELSIKFTQDSTWAFIKNGQVVDSGILEIDGQTLTLKHEECTHDHDHHGHAHHHEDHVYTFSFAEKNKKLHLKADNKTTTFTKY